MVERLAERLRKGGGDVEGWLKLIRAYNVLGERQKAQDALLEAKSALNGKPAEIERIDELARELNIGG